MTKEEWDKFFNKEFNVVCKTVEEGREFLQELSIINPKAKWCAGEKLLDYRGWEEYTKEYMVSFIYYRDAAEILYEQIKDFANYAIYNPVIVYVNDNNNNNILKKELLKWLQGGGQYERS